MATRRNIGEIEAEIAQTRDELGRTLEALERNLLPREVVQKGYDMFLDGLGDQRNRVGETLARNPIPVALIGVGVGFLLWSSFGGRSSDRNESTDVSASPREGRGQSLDRRFREVAEPAAATVERLDDAVQSAAVPIADKVARGRFDLPGRVSDMVEKYPLTTAGLVALAGALLAVALPPTRPEDAHLGQVRDALRDKAAAAGLEAVERVSEAASDVASEAAGIVEAAFTEDAPEIHQHSPVHQS